MKFIATFALIFCAMPCTWTAPTESELTDPTLVTTGAYLLGKFCRIGPLDALIGVGVVKGTSAGMKKYKETNDIMQATQVAAQEGLTGAAGFLTKVIGTAITGAALVKDIKDGKDLKEAFDARTKETIDYIKDELIKNPKGKLANSLLTGANVAMTWTVGPIPAWIASSLAVATADGMAKYQETHDVNEAAKEAYASGYKNVARVVRALCGVVASGTGFAEDITNGKDKSAALKDRGAQAIKSILGQDSKEAAKSSSPKSASTSKTTAKPAPAKKGKK